MGFLSTDGDIFLDMVLTDEGRERLSRNNGTFVFTRFRFGDDEINYNDFNQLTGSDSKDRKILDTPIFEAFTNEVIALKHPLVTVRNARLQFFPQMVSKPASISLKEQTDSVGGGQDVIIYQDIARAQTIIPAELIDLNYIVELDNDLLFVSDETPIAISPYNVGRYIIPATPGKQTAANGSQCNFNVRVQTLTTEVFDVLVGANVAKPRSITTNVVVTGQQSGLSKRISTTISEYATS
jgi:hypothetical protein